MSSSESDSSVSSSSEPEDEVEDGSINDDKEEQGETHDDNAEKEPVDVMIENPELLSEKNNNENVKVPKRSVSHAPHWNGQRLFPPSRKISKPSKAWSFGGFVKNTMGLLVLDSTICSLCGKKQTYRNTPTNLTQHLMKEHAQEFADENVTKTEIKIDNYFRAECEKKKYNVNHPKQKAIRSKLMEWVVKSNRPLTVVEDDKLVEAFGIADDKIRVPSRRMIRADIEEAFKKMKAETVEEFSKVDFFSSTNDAGSSSGGKSFVDINVHYLTEDFHPKKKILDVLEMKESKSAVNYRKRVKETEKHFGIEGKVFSYTTDNEATMKAAFTSNERNGCFAHIESKASKKALDKQNSLKSMRSKLRKVSKKANKSSKFMYAIQQQQKKRGLRLITLKQEVKTRFTSTHTCIRSFLNDPNEKTDKAMDEVKVDENIAAINQAMKDAKFKKSEIANLEIKPEDTRKMKELVKVLDVLEEGITLIGGEKFATGSAVLPFLYKFNKLLEIDDEEPLFISTFKKDLKEDMKGRCAANLNVPMLAKASFFDKRFSQLKFLEDRHKDEVMGDIKDELKVLAERERNTVQSDTEKEPPKKKRFLGAGLSDSEDEVVGGVDDELDRYSKERKLKGDGDPFEWWRNRRQEYPLMAKLARKYLSVQGTSTPAERVISRLGNVLTKRRQRLSGEIFSKMMSKRPS